MNCAEKSIGVALARACSSEVSGRECCRAECRSRIESKSAETSAKNPEFKKVYDDYKKFLDEQNFWFRVAENEYARFMFSRKS